MRRLSASKRFLIVFAILTVGLTVFLFGTDNLLSRTATAAYRNSVVVATGLTATKTGTLDASAGGDVNGNGVINPGDRIKYTVTITNSGADATGVNLSDTIDQNTTYTAGSIIASPVAVSDSYSAIGNVNISVPAASGVLANDQNANTGAACTTGNTCAISPTGSFASVNGGAVTLNADGSFTYNPPVGFEGADTFTYTLSNGTGLTDAATVTINVSGMIWFVNNNSGACSSNCNGRLSNPFTTLAAFNTANALSGGLNPDNNDNIFLYESATQYTGAVTLRTGQKLIGQDATATLAAITGLSTQSYSATLPAMNSANGTITNLGGTVTLNTNATLRGFSINSGASTGINDPAAAITGVNTGEINVTTTTGTAVLLSDVGGTLSFTSINVNGAAKGVSLINNSASAAAVSFTVTGTGTTAGSGGTIQNISGRGVELIGPASGNQPSLSLKNMNLTNTAQTNGDTESTCANVGGGTNLNCSAAIHIVNVTGVSLDNVDVNGSNQVGVNGNNVTNFSMTNGSKVRNCGNESNETGMQFANLLGTSAITGATFTGNYNSGLNVVNTASTAGTLNVTSTAFTGNGVNTHGSALMKYSGDQAANMTVNVQSSSFNGSNSYGYFTDTATTAHVTSTINNSTFGTSSANALGLAYGNSASSKIDFNVTNNTIVGGNANNGAIYMVSFSETGTTTASAYLNGTFDSNHIGTAGVAGSGCANNCAGVGILPAGAGAMNITITNNDIRQVSSQGISLLANAGTTGTLIMHIKHNTLAEPQTGFSSFLRAISLTPGNSAGASPTSCFEIGGSTVADKNTISGSWQASAAIRVANQNNTGTTRFPGYGGSATDQTALQTFVEGNNIGTSPYALITPGTGISGGAACTATPLVASLGFESEGNTMVCNSNNALALTIASYPLPSQLITGIQPLFKNSMALSIEKTVRDENAAEIVEVSRASYLNSIRQTAHQVYDGLSEAISPTAYAAGETVTKSLGNLPSGESITVQFVVTVNSTPSSLFSVSNTANITAAGGISINSTTATNAIIQPPSIAKAFGAAFVATNNTTSLTYTITNGNSATLSGLAFSDTLPAGLVVNSPSNGLTNSCGGTVTATAGTSVISLSGGSVVANATCTVKVDVKGTIEGTKTSQTSGVASTNGGTGNTASATLNVINAPTFTKAFGAATIQLNGSTTLSFTITNASTVFPLNNVSFTDTLPAGLTVSNPNNLTGSCGGGGGTITATAGSGSISLSGATLATSASCTFSVNVTGTSAGVKNNSTTLSTTELGTGAAATATLTVITPPTISKAFNPTSIVSGGTSVVTLTLSNSNTTGAASLTNASFTDSLVNMTASGGAVGGTCAGTSPASLSSGATALSFSGITIPNNGSCTITFGVTSNAAGINPNTTSGVATTQTSTPGTASNTANLTVTGSPQVTKSFAPSAIGLNGVSTLTLTISNPAANATALSGVGLTDAFPSGMEVDATPAATNSCSTGTFAPAAAATSISISGATIPVNTTCTFSVRVKGTSLGSKLNTTGAVTSTNGGTGATASATLSIESNEGDVSPRPNGDAFVDSDDIQQIRRFSVGLDLPYQSNEFQRADVSPRSTLGDGFVDADDVQQARRYSVGLDGAPAVPAGGPTTQATPTPSAPVNSIIDMSSIIDKSNSDSTKSSAPEAGRAVRIVNQTSSASQTVVVPINVDTTGDETGYTFSIAFDNTKLSATAVTIGGLGGNVVSNINNTTGTIGFSITSFSGSNGTIAAVTDQTLVTVTFTVAGNASAGSTNINFTDNPSRRKVSGTDPNTALPQPTFTDGTVSISGPTAATVTVGGKVTTPTGRGIANVRISLTDSEGNTRTAITTSFGYYRFENVRTGETYILSATGKHFSFSQPTQVLNVSDETNQINFIANEEKRIRSF